MTDVNQLITDHLDIWTAATEKKSTAGRGNGGGVSLHGIKKLRELIFELAVRGKLVAQDGKDQSVEGLLHEIAQLRKQVLKDQKAVGKWSAASKFDEPKQPPPDRWKWVPLADVLDWHVGGGTPSKTRQEYWNGGIPWASVKDVGHEKFLHETVDQISALGLKNSSSNLVPKGCLLIITRMGLGRLSINQIDVAINQDIRALSVSSLMSLEYCYLFFKTLKMEGSGLTVKGVKVGDLLSSPFPLPPFAEQHRIVAKVDELMVLCDALERQAEDSLKAHQTLVETCLATLTNSQSPEDLTQNWTRIEAHFDTLFTTEESATALGSAILEMAAMGLLTRRASSQVTPDEILKQIAREKKRLVDRGELRREKPLEKLDPKKVPFALPSGWVWAKIGDVALFTQYGTSQKAAKLPEGVPVLAMGNIQAGAVSLESEKLLPRHWEEFPALLLQPGDLLYNRTNSAELVGKTGLFDGPEDAYTFASYLIRIRLDHSLVRPQYLNFVMNSPFFRATQIVPKIKKQTGQANVNGTFLKNMLVPLPPTEEQDSVIKQIEELSKVCGGLAKGFRQVGAFQRIIAETLTSKIH